MKHRSNASVGDSLKVTVVKNVCTDDCPYERARDGDVSATAIRAGDTVLCSGVKRKVTSITTDFLGKTGTFVVCGRRRQMAAALLLLENETPQFADEHIQKICPECDRIVVRFR